MKEQDRKIFSSLEDVKLKDLQCKHTALPLKDKRIISYMTKGGDDYATII